MTLKSMNFSFSHELSVWISFRRECVPEKKRYIPAVVRNFRKREEKPSNSLSRQSPFRLHFTIRFSIGDNVNVLSPSSKTRHTTFTRLVSF